MNWNLEFIERSFPIASLMCFLADHEVLLYG